MLLPRFAAAQNWARVEPAFWVRGEPAAAARRTRAEHKKGTPARIVFFFDESVRQTPAAPGGTAIPGPR